jgi:uncharacterized integral membrane protein
MRPAGGAPEPVNPPPGFDHRGRVQRTKFSVVWAGLIAAALVLILLIIFIAQNLNPVTIHFLGFDGKISLGLAMLIAALCGLAIALVSGTVRIVQLRRSLRANADTEGFKHPREK